MAERDDRTPGLRRAPVSAILFLLALLPRLSALWRGFVTPDEPSWVFRAIRFAQALAEGRWADTFQMGHPGVVTMWLGAAGVRWQQLVGRAAADADLAWIDRVAWVTPDNGELFRRLAHFLPSGRLAMALLTSLGVVGVYALAARLWDRRMALVGAALLALDPFAVALSGLLHVDAPAMTFCTLCLLAWLNALQRRDRERWLPDLLFALLSGLCAGLAVLTKSPSVFLAAPVALAALLSWLLGPRSGAPPLRGRAAARGSERLPGARSLRDRSATRRSEAPPSDPSLRSFSQLRTRRSARKGRSGGAGMLSFSESKRGRSVREDRSEGAGLPRSAGRRRSAGWIALLGAVWLVGAAGALFGAFPAMWVDPGGVLQGIYGLADRHLDLAHRVSFFRGVSGGDPGALFYPTVLAFRLTPITLVGLALSLPPLLTGWRSPLANRRRVGGLCLWGMVVGYAAFLTVGAKKFDRYLLPVFGAADLLAALGWMWAARWVYGRAQRGKRVMPARAFAAVLGALLFVQAASVLPSWPYYLDAYNPLAGGMGAALRTLPVGWGEGLEQVAATLNRRLEAARGARPGVEWVVAGASPVTLSPLFEGRVIPLAEESRGLADKAIVTAMDLQIDPQGVGEAISGMRLEDSVRIGGREALWLYDAALGAEKEHLARYGAPNDLIVCDAPSSACRQSEREYVRILDGAGESEIVERLNGWSPAHWRLWLLSYPSASPITAAALRRQLEATAVALDEVDLGYARATLYLLPDQPLFRASEGGFEGADFGALSAVGGALEEERVPADGVVRFTLRWRADETPGADYAGFVHLLDEAGRLRTSGRGEERIVSDLGWPTSSWATGEEVELTYGVGLPPGLPPGRYQVAVGLADAATGAWALPVDAEGRIAGTTAPLLQVEVFPAARPPDPEALQMNHPADAAWGEQIALLGYEHPPSARVGERVVVELGWLGLALWEGDASLRLSLRDGQGGAAHQVEYALSGHPTSLWREGEVIRELYDLPLPAGLEGGTYRVEVEVIGPGGEPLGAPVPLGTMALSLDERVYYLEQPPQVAVNARLGEGIVLLGYDLPSTAAQSGAEVSLTLYWQCAAPLDKSYTVFAHLLDEGGVVRGQQDRVPARGRAPTSGWVEGQILTDEYALPLDADAPPGAYRIEVGMYDPRDMTRLPVVDASGEALPEGRVVLVDEVGVR